MLVSHLNDALRNTEEGSTMAWGYGPDEVAASLYLTLTTQGLLFLFLLIPWFRTWSKALSQPQLTFYGVLAITGTTALYHLVFPLESGITSGIVTLFLVVPVTILNTLIFSIRAALREPPSPLVAVEENNRPQRSTQHVLVPFLTIPTNLLYWFLLLLAGS